MEPVSFLTLKDIAKYVRTSVASKLLMTILRDKGRVFTFTEERHNRLNRYVSVINAYKDGVPLADIETKFGCTRRTIFDYVERAGVPRRSFKPEEIRQAVLRDYKAGIPISKIMDLHNVKRRFVQQIAADAGERRYRRKN